MTAPAPHDPYEGMAALYAIGGLNRVESERFEHHLETCHECVQEIRSLLEVSYALTQAATPVNPPPSLRDQILGNETSIPESTELTSTTPHKPGSRLAPTYRAIAVVCLVISGTLGWWLAQQVNQVRDLRGNLDDLSLRIQVADMDAATSRQLADELRGHANVLTAPDVMTVGLVGQSTSPEASGRAFLSPSEGVVIAASNLPPLAPGYVYQVWFVTPPDPLSAGSVRVDGSGYIFAGLDVQVGQDLPLAVAVTLEPEGSANQPTGEVYLLGRTDR